MSRHYNSKQAQELYDNFNRMFETEGNCYYSLKESIENDYKHGQIPDTANKLLLEGILRDVTVDFFIKNIEVLPAKEFFID